MRLPIVRNLCAGMLAFVTPMMTWQDRHVMPEGISGGAAAFLASRFLYAGGTTWRNQTKCWLAETHVYDPLADAWSPGPSLPEPLAYSAILRSEDALELLGGANAKGASRKCWRLEARTMHWIESGALPAGSIFATAEFLHGQAYLFGGCADPHLAVCSNDVLRRNGSGVWEKVSDIPGEPVALSASVVVRDRVFLFGGCTAQPSGGVRNRNEARSFDPRTHQWTTLAPLPAAVRAISAVPVNRRYIFLAGGYVEPQGFSAASYLYDIELNRYQPVESLPLPVMGMQLVEHEGRIWGAGGEDRTRGRTARLIEGTINF